MEPQGLMASFDVAMIIWGTISVLLMVTTAIAVFFAKSWKLRIDKDYTAMSTMIHTDMVTKDKAIEKIRDEHSHCELKIVREFVDKPTFQNQVGHCVSIQNQIFSEVKALTKEITAFKVEIIREIKNGHNKK